MQLYASRYLVNSKTDDPLCQGVKLIRFSRTKARDSYQTGELLVRFARDVEQYKCRTYCIDQVLPSTPFKRSYFYSNFNLCFTCLRVTTAFYIDFGNLLSIVQQSVALRLCHGTYYVRQHMLRSDSVVTMNECPE
jgi:hypothetical protein